MEDEMEKTKPVAVPFVEGILEANAVRTVNEAGLTPDVHRVPSDKAKVGYVFDQNPDAGQRIDRGNTVDILVSTGKPKVTVPSVIGRPLAEAGQALADAGLKAKG